MRETIYQSDGEGPSVVATFRCEGCRHLQRRHSYNCGLKDNRFVGYEQPLETPSWCPIVSADPETWEKRLRGYAAMDAAIALLPKEE